MHFGKILSCIVALSVNPAFAGDIQFGRTCDGSAAAWLGDDRIAVADDEDGTLWLYGINGGEPERRDLPGLSGDEPDFEGAARIGDRIYWIGSHGRNAKGKVQPSRQVIVGTDLDGRIVGTPFKDLLPLLPGADPSEKLGLADSIGTDGTSRARAAEAGGLNIEGLAAKPDGSAWIGLRNPRSDDGEAVLIPLDALASVGTAAPEIRPGKALRILIDELGVRDLAWSEDLRAFLIIGGTSSAGDDFRLYRWAGDDSPPQAIMRVEGIGPEAVVPLPGRRTALLLSDDGDRRVAVAKAECDSGWRDGTCACKHLVNDGKKSFRGRVVELN